MNAVHTVDTLWERFGDSIFLSIMNQYTPMPTCDTAVYPELAGKVSKRVYDHLLEHCLKLQMKNVYFQEGETNRESFIPEFNGEGVLKGLR